MPYLTGAVVLVGLLCLVDLVLTLGVVKRLHQHAELLARSPGGSAGAGPPLAIGQTPADFESVSVDGRRLSRQDLDGGGLVGFFMPHCRPCHERMPEFTAYASTLPGGLDRALAVVVGNGQEAEQMASQLGEAARVVVEQPGGPIATAFAVSGFPTVFALDAEGAISAAGFTLDKLPVLAEA